MRTFILRARKGTTRWELVRAKVGSREHFEVIAHSVINAFFFSQGFRDDVEVFIILDSAADFPRTIKLSGGNGGADSVSIAGFHEDAVLTLIEQTLKSSQNLQKDATLVVAPGVQISGFGFDKLVGMLLETRQLYLLDRKGDDIQAIEIAADPVFILSDHLAMPKKSIQGLERRGLKTISLGKKMLFAAQCVVLLNYELDRVE